jgi:hypothetical protein
MYHGLRKRGTSDIPCGRGLRMTRRLFHTRPMFVGATLVVPSLLRSLARERVAHDEVAGTHKGCPTLARGVGACGTSQR